MVRASLRNPAHRPADRRHEQRRERQPRGRGALLGKVRETAGQQRTERRKQQLLAAAQAAVQAERHQEAIEALEAARIEFPSAPEFVDMLRLAREHVARQREAATQAIAQNVRRMLDQGEFAAAIAKLEETLQQAPDNVLEQLLSQARQGATEHESKIRASLQRVEQLAKAGDAEKALSFLDGLAPLVRKAPALVELRADVARQAEQVRKLAKPLEKVKAHSDRGEFTAARDLLQDCVAQVGDLPVLVNTAARLDEAERAFAVTFTTGAIEKAQQQVKAGQAAQATATLETASKWLKFVEPKLREKWEAAQKQAQKPAPKPVAPPAAKPEAGAATKMYSVAGLEQVFQGAQPGPVAPPPQPASAAPGSGVTSILSSDNLQQALAAAAAGEPITLPPSVRKVPPPAEPPKPKKAEPKVEPKKAEPAKVEPKKAEPAKAAPKAEPKVEPKKAEPRVEVKAEPKKAERVEPRVPVAVPEPAPRHVPPPVPVEAPSSKKWVGIAAAAGVIVIGAVSYFVMHKPAGPAGGEATTKTETPAPSPTAAPTAAPTTAPPPAAAPMGTLAVEAKDDKGAGIDGADVFVDNQLKDTQVKGGQATFKLSPGRHQIRIEKSGYGAAPAQRVEVAKDSEARVQFTLNKSAEAVVKPPPNPYLMVTSVAGATIKVDQKTIDNVGPDGKFSFQVEPGAHKVDISLRGYRPWSGTITAKAGERVPVNGALTAIPAPVINFSASPASIQEGQSTELKWDIQNATEVSIEEHGGGQLASRAAAIATETRLHSLASVWS